MTQFHFINAGITSKKLQLFNQECCFLINLLILSGKMPWCGGV